MKNYGMKIKVKFKAKSPFKNAKAIYRNVTEIHYNYCDFKEFGEKRTKKNFIFGHKIAFESNIHSTGITQPIEYIEEFETEIETKKAKEF